MSAEDDDDISEDSEYVADEVNKGIAIDGAKTREVIIRQSVATSKAQQAIDLMVGRNIVGVLNTTNNNISTLNAFHREVTHLFYKASLDFYDKMLVVTNSINSTLEKFTTTFQENIGGKNKKKKNSGFNENEDKKKFYR